MYINLKDNDMSITRFVKLTFIQHRDGRAVAPSNKDARLRINVFGCEIRWQPKINTGIKREKMLNDNLLTRERDVTVDIKLL